MARVYVAVHWILPWRHMKSPPARRSPATSGAAARTSSPPPAPPASSFRLASFVCLLAIDLVAIGFALYAALALREVYYGHTPILWGVLWTGASRTGYPFVALVMVLVFWQAGLYAERERRAGFGRIVSSLVVVALLVLAFGLGTGHDFTTFGLIPTALVIATVLDGLLRASYETVSREALHILGVRRRAIVVGEGEHLEHLLRTLGSARGGIDYEFVGVVSARATPAGAAAARRRRGPPGRARASTRPTS